MGAVEIGSGLICKSRQPLHAVMETCKLTLTDELGTLTDALGGRIWVGLSVNG